MDALPSWFGDVQKATVKKSPPSHRDMKHPLRVTLLLVLLFVAAQLVGLLLVNLSISSVTVTEEGIPVLEHTETAIGERPRLSGYQSFLYLVVGVAVGTALLLLLIRFRKVRLWKAWFFLAVFLAQSVALGVLLPQLVALLVALLLAALKIFRPNPWVHNLTEVLMYAGIAVLLVPILDVYWSLVLLLAISVYDAWAVWRSKHMVRMAEFQKSSEVFAGLMVPKRGDAPVASSSGSARSKTKAPASAPLSASLSSPKKVAAEAPTRGGYAILGGGDIAFPLLFSGAVMEGLILGGATRGSAYAQSLLVTLGASMAIALLFLYAKKDRYYPAMPFVTAGCVAGWLVLLALF